MQLQLVHSIELVNRMTYSQIRDGDAGSHDRTGELMGP
jgi:hypothetical protein